MGWVKKSFILANHVAIVVQDSISHFHKSAGKLLIGRMQKIAELFEFQEFGAE